MALMTKNNNESNILIYVYTIPSPNGEEEMGVLLIPCIGPSNLSALVLKSKSNNSNNSNSNNSNNRNNINNKNNNSTDNNKK
jgi:hypothetical protein